MDSFLQAFFYAIPYLLAAGLAAIFILLGVISAARSTIVVYPFLVALFWASDISYGNAAATSGSIFTRGVGILVFPAFVWAMGLALVWIKFSQQFSRTNVVAIQSNISLWFLGWLLLLTAHVVFAGLTDQSIRDAIGSAGFSNIIWVWLLLATMRAAFRTDLDVKWLLCFIVLVGLARAVFGLVRWAAFGGDPANAYANRHGLDIRLTFFDINDGLICMLTFCVAAMQLFSKDPTPAQSGVYRAILWFAIVVPIVCIVLSFRRTALLGLVIGGAFVLLQLPSRARWRLVGVGLPVALVGIGYSIWKRLSQTKQAGGMLDFLFDVTPRDVGADSPRFLELRLAWQSFLDHPIFGVGSWGHYDGWQQISWQLYEGGGGTYLHSGVLHIGLKAGIVGLLLLVGLVLSFTLFWRKTRGVLKGDLLTLAVAGVAGCLFVIPDFVIATSLTKHRSVFFIGFCMSLPYIAYAVACTRQQLKVEPVLGAVGRFATRRSVVWQPQRPTLGA